MTAEVQSIDPRDGRVVEVLGRETSSAGVRSACAAAAAAAPELSARGRNWRAELLRSLSGALESARQEVVALADRETALGTARLDAELTRTCFQLELFADVVAEGSYLEVVIDHAGDTAMGPRPDLRRMLVPVGPVAVFAASNFPLAFSVPGGDTSAALAAGCPVIVKAHPSHPSTSDLLLDILKVAAGRVDAPQGTLAVVHGKEAGIGLVTDPQVRAGSFTGSLGGGRSLADLAAGRPEPIPFYAEMASLNPVIVTAGALDAGSADIADSLAGSILLGNGQFCTKPGLVFLPDGTGDRPQPVIDRIVRAMGDTGEGTALNAQVAAGYSDGTQRLATLPGVHTALLPGASSSGCRIWPAAFVMSAADFRLELTDEVFGPSTVFVTYRDAAQLLETLELLPGSLTATVYTGGGSDTLPARLIEKLVDKAGRVVFDGVPTGVAVAEAQHHGGPWPSTNSVHTSVGATSIRRFLRPIAFQNAPSSVLPAELRDGPSPVPRRVDGRFYEPVTNREAPSAGQI